MPNDFPKVERLKSTKEIDRLFTEGRSIGKFPLRLVYANAVGSPGVSVKFGVSVSKKYFKRAVDRNYIKRILREIYRLNKDLLKSDSDNQNIYMLLYQSKEIMAFDTLNAKAVDLFLKVRKVQAEA